MAYIIIDVFNSLKISEWGWYLLFFLVFYILQNILHHNKKNKGEIVMTTFAEKLKIARGNLDLKQEQLAALIGKSVKTVQRWEYDERCPNVKDLSKLSKVLKVTPNYLVYDELDDPADHSEKKSPDMFYWGGVVENAQVVAGSDNDAKKETVCQMLKMALSFFQPLPDQRTSAPVLANIGGHHNENNYSGDH